MAAFRNLMKSKGLLGGKYSLGLDGEEVNELLDKMDNDKTVEGSEKKKRKLEEEDEEDERVDRVEPIKSKTVNIGGVISSPG